jgi:hypothetical protein
MPKYRATVQVSGLAGENPRAVRSALDEQLRKSGLENCRIVTLDVDAPLAKMAPPRSANPPPARRRQIDAGGLLLVGAAAWAIWFFWMMLSSASE